MPIISLFGPDGSGKTTLARGLAGRLRGRGLRVRLSWMRGTHTLASVLASVLSRFKALSGADNPYYGLRVPPRLRRIWQVLEFVSMLPALASRFLIPSALGYVVVGERGWWTSWCGSPRRPAM